MPFLLFHGEPTCETRFAALPDGSPSTHLGDCITVLPDDVPPSDAERRLFLVVETDMKLDECVRVYLPHGAPDDVRKAAEDADAALMDAERALAALDPVKDFILYAGAQSARDAAVKASADAHEALRQHPTRGTKIDLSAVPADRVKACADFRAAFDAHLPASVAARKAAVLDVISKTMLPTDVTGGVLSKSPTEIASAQKDDRTKDLLRAVADVAQAEALQPVLDAFADVPPHFMDAASLAAACVAKQPSKTAADVGAAALP